MRTRSPAAIREDSGGKVVIRDCLRRLAVPIAAPGTRREGKYLNELRRDHIVEEDRSGQGRDAVDCPYVSSI
ncbi:MAG: hypothetical protein P8I99_12405 [Acidimicrobiales bacterium]|nr:hypothetical protein [Acidimicrobiales bacterium]